MRSDSQKHKDHRNIRHAGDVYVNRLLDLRQIEAVGLDLDHTLAVYDDQAVNELAFSETCRYLIDDRGYPRSIAQLNYTNSEISRGLVADLQFGALVKLDSRDRVRRAFWGSEALDAATIAARYGTRSIAVQGDRYADFDSPFDLPASQLFVKVVEVLSQVAPGRPDYRSVLVDIRQMLDRAHTRGELKRHILRNPSRFVERRASVVAMIEKLRDAGKKTFLITNSGFRYATDLVDHVFGPQLPAGSWRSLFDAVIVHADKPHFFSAAESPSANIEWIERTGACGVSTGGSAADLEQRLGAGGRSVLFIGDNPAADIVAAAVHGWRTAMVVPELAHHPFSADGGETIGRAGDRCSLWGSVFWEDGTLTRFSRIIREYADVWGAAVEHILRVPPDHVFGAP
ncbi:MAG: HAD-IG family 5'-nucleotidase [Candidatus Krumholzibacteria bacterium]|nr:HAD-IG family 5'-nucleotidase [Candidatus Krumholzibacteria bacterium]